MHCKIQIFKNYTFYIILILSITVINSFFFNKVIASNYDVENIVIKENFDKDFKKDDIYDKAFLLAFDQLILTLLTSSDKKKIQNTNLKLIKKLIDSFNIKNEKFVNDIYSAKFTVSFNKKNTLNYFETKNIFPSIPKKMNLLLIPILIEDETNEVKYFHENKIYINWNISNENHHLLNYILPEDEIEDREIINKNFLNIESYNFEDIISKYNIMDYIIIIINKNNKKIKILSKIYMNDNYEIINNEYENKNFEIENNLNNIIKDLKIRYEDMWKKYNVINTSIKLPITLLVNSNRNSKIKTFERFADGFDLISSYKIVKFDNKYIYYKLIFNGSPKMFFYEAQKYGFNFNNENQNWIVK